MGIQRQLCIKTFLVSAGLMAAGLSVGSVAGCASSTTAERESSSEQIRVRTVTREEALADFDRAWEIVNETHFDTSFNGVDWVAVRDELRPKASEAMTRNQVRRVISEALDRLGQSHFGIIPNEEEAPAQQKNQEHANEMITSNKGNGGSVSASGGLSDGASDAGYTEIEAVIPDDSASDGDGDADTGIDIRIIDGQAVVSAIRDQSPAHLAGVRTGWILSKIRSDDVQDGLDRLQEALGEDEIGIHAVSMISNRLQGPEDSSIDLTFIDGNGDEVERNLARIPMPGEFVKFGNLPPLSTHLEWSRVSATHESGQKSEIGVIKFNIWMIPIAPKFERAMYELRDVDGIIIDLRGNPGGVGALAASVGRFLVSEKGSLGTMTMRGAELQFNIDPVIVTTWGEPIDPFGGPIAILTDSGSASTSEVFAGGLQSLGRVKVFGTRSAGMALPAGMDKLPSGDVLLHAIANFETSTGYQLEHGGVVPDEEVKLSREDLLKGIDSPRQAAIEWIKDSTHE